MTEKICPECNGEGVVDQGTEDESRCPTCNGSGVVPDDGQGSEEVWNTHLERAMTSGGIDQGCDPSACRPASVICTRVR
jgi:DnaJ-class molecular chaperone